MEKYSSTICLILVFAVWLLLILGCQQTWKENHTAETEATITSIGTGCGDTSTVVKFTYTVNNRRLENWTCYSHSRIMNAGFKVNDKAKACYDPSNPEDSSVMSTRYQCQDD